MTTASKITMARIALVPVFFVLALWDYKYAPYLALAVFILASATDGIDGYVARKYNQVTDFGKFIDPLADKLLVTAAILIFVENGQMPAWCAMLVIAREFAVTSLRLVAVGQGVVIAAAKSGKIKTASSIVAICFMLLPFPEIVNTIAVAVIVFVTLWSGVDYFIKNKKVFQK